MKRFVIVSIILISFCLSAQVKHSVAVLNFEDRSGKVEADVLQDANDYLRMYLESVESYFVVSKEQQNATAPQVAECHDKLCRIQAGQNLGVNLIAYPHIASANGQYMINVEIIDVAKRSTTISVSESWGGDHESLDSISESVARKIAVKQKNIDALNASISSLTGSRDNDACEKARKKNNESGWGKYIKSFPEGLCVAEANEALDSIACAEAEDNNSLKGWKEYLDKYPNGKCSATARENFSNRENIEQMMKKGRDMKIAGATLLTVGAVGFTLGFVLGAAVPRHYEYCNNWGCEEREDRDSSIALGWGIGGGIGGTMILIGIPLLSVGVIKEKEAKSYLEINNLAVIPQKGGAYAQVGFSF